MRGCCCSLVGQLATQPARPDPVVSRHKRGSHSAAKQCHTNDNIRSKQFNSRHFAFSLRTQNIHVNTHLCSPSFLGVCRKVVLAKCGPCLHIPGVGWGGVDVCQYLGQCGCQEIQQVCAKCMCSRQLMHHRIKISSSGSYYITPFIIHTMFFFFSPKIYRLYGKHVLRLMSDISHGENWVERDSPRNGPA